MLKRIHNDYPSLRFSGYTNKWESLNLGEICDYKNGGSFEEHVVDNGQYKLITLNSIDITGKLKAEHKTVNHADWFLEKNDLIMVLSDVAHGNFLGLVDIIPDNNSFVLNQRMGLLRKNNDNVNLNFLRLYINNNQRYFRVHGQGSSQQNLSKGDILKFKVFYPAIEEQQKIASFLSSIDDWIENLTQQKVALEKYKKGMMQKIFSQEIRFKDENGKDFPDWEIKKLGEITYNFDNERKPISSDKREFGIYPYYGANGLVDYVNGYIFDGEYVLVAEDGVVDTTKYPIHIVKGKFWANNHAHILQGKDVSNLFLYYSLLNTKFMRYITGSAQTKLNGRVLNQIEIKLPHSKEQQKIGNFLSSIDDLQNNNGLKINKAVQWKKGLMQKLFI